MKIYKSDIEIKAIQLNVANRKEILNLIPNIFNPTISRANPGTNEKEKTGLPLHLEFKKDNILYTAKEGDYIIKINGEIFTMLKELFENIFVEKNNYLKKELKCKNCNKIFKSLKDIQCVKTENAYYNMKYEDEQIIYHKKGTIKCDFKYSCPVCGTFLDIKEKDILNLLK